MINIAFKLLNIKFEIFEYGRKLEMREKKSIA